MKVLICGGGLAGAALSCMLAKQGHECIVYEKTGIEQVVYEQGKVDFGEVGGSVLIQVNGVRVLERLGVLDDVLAVSQTTLKMSFRKIDGSAPIELGLGLDKKHRPLLILRSRLHNIFMRHAQRHGVRTFLGKKISNLTQNESQVTATFEDGTVAVGDIFIGADGIHSKTRRLLFGEDKTATASGVIGYLGITDTVKKAQNGIKFGEFGEALSLYTDRFAKREVTFVDVGVGMHSFTITTFSEPEEGVGNDWTPYTDLPKESTRLADTLEEWGLKPELANYVRHAKRITPFTVYDVIGLTKFYEGRVCLLGDSAHGMPPNLGQGLNMCLEDVGVLGEAFARFPKRSDISKAFEVYNNVRFPRATHVQEQTRVALQRNYADSNMGAAIIQFVFRIIARFRIGEDLSQYDYMEDVEKAVEQVTA